MHIPTITCTHTTLNTHTCTQRTHTHTHTHTRKLGGGKGERGCFIQHFSMTFSYQSELKCRCADLSWTTIQVICGGMTWNLGSEILLLQVIYRLQRNLKAPLSRFCVLSCWPICFTVLIWRPNKALGACLEQHSVHLVSEMQEQNRKIQAQNLTWSGAENSQILSLCVGKIWKICRTAFNLFSSGHQKELYFFHCDPFVSPILRWKDLPNITAGWMNVYIYRQERLCFLRGSQCPRSASISDTFSVCLIICILICCFDFTKNKAIL